MVFICNMTMPQVTRPEVGCRFRKEQGVYVLDHSPYSPDLVPCDFILFSSQEKSCWQKYTSRQKLGVSILNPLRGIPQKDYEKVINDWIKSLKICVSVRDGILTI